MAVWLAAMDVRIRANDQDSGRHNREHAETMTRKPKLGQNFLTDPAAIRGIVDALGDVSGKTVLEIGPGEAALTKTLAARAQRLIAVELDRELAPRLRRRFMQYPNVEILEQDILEVDFASVVASPGTQLVVIGNLPYYLTSDILLRLFSWHLVISQAVVMVQREVADRVAASPGSRDYGLLSATAQMYARVDKLFTLPPQAFSPPPEVFSTVLRLTMQPRFTSLGVDPALFHTFLRQSFAQKRKTLANNLRAAGYGPTQIQSAFAASGTPLQVRAEALTLEGAASLHLALGNAEERATDAE